MIDWANLILFPGGFATSVSCQCWRGFLEKLPGGFSVQPALIPRLPNALDAILRSFDPFSTVIFVKKRQNHNNIHCHDTVSRNHCDPRRCIPSYGEYDLRPGISFYDEYLVPDSQARSRPPSGERRWRRKACAISPARSRWRPGVPGRVLTSPGCLLSCRRVSFGRGRTARTGRSRWDRGQGPTTCPVSEHRWSGSRCWAAGPH